MVKVTVVVEVVKKENFKCISMAGCKLWSPCLAINDTLLPAPPALDLNYEVGNGIIQ